MLRMFTPGREIGSEKMALADRSAVLLVIEKLEHSAGELNRL